jgi:hypothetical protein
MGVPICVCAQWERVSALATPRSPTCGAGPGLERGVQRQGGAPAPGLRPTAGSARSRSREPRAGPGARPPGAPLPPPPPGPDLDNVVWAHEDVGGLDVPVDDARVVHRLHRLAQLQEDLPHGALGQRAAAARGGADEAREVACGRVGGGGVAWGGVGWRAVGWGGAGRGGVGRARGGGGGCSCADAAGACREAHAAAGGERRAPPAVRI